MGDLHIFKKMKKLTHLMMIFILLTLTFSGGDDVKCSTCDGEFVVRFSLIKGKKCDSKCIADEKFYVEEKDKIIEDAKLAITSEKMTFKWADGANTSEIMMKNISPLCEVTE